MNDQLMNSMIGRSPQHRRADAEAGEARFADRRVDDPPRAEVVEHSFGDFVGAVVLRDFLAHQEDVFVALHLLGHRGAESFSELHYGHMFAVSGPLSVDQSSAVLQELHLPQLIPPQQIQLVRPVIDHPRPRFRLV